MSKTDKTPIDRVIEKVQGIYRGWNRETTLRQMRDDWDTAFWSGSIDARTQDDWADGVAVRWVNASQARILPQPSAAAAESLAVAGRTPSSSPDMDSAMPSASFSPCAPPQRRSKSLATSAGAVSGREVGSRVLMYLHGGGFKMGSLKSHHDFMARLSMAAGCLVLGVDYRLAPEHIFPAQLDDTLNAYRWLLRSGHRPDNIILAGDSAGGCLVASALLALRDNGEPLPAAAVMLSALTDLEAGGDSYASCAALDPIHNRKLILALARQYLGPGGDARNPLASPLHGELHGLPPLLLHVGSRETGLDDSVQFAAKAQAAGVAVRLVNWPGMIHFFQQFAGELPEAASAIEDICVFLNQHWLADQSQVVKAGRRP
ncbi:MAG: alpha/beta hydrolase [Halieaceae bacterium]|nr:alpha/beta hydrolase [Halieaceae bacterium]